MRTLERPLRGNCASAPIDEGAHSIGIVGVPGDQHVEIVHQTEQPRSNILDGRQPQRLQLDDLLAPFPADWERQRRALVDDAGAEQ